MSRAIKFVDCNDDPWESVGADDAPVALPAAVPHRLFSLAQWQAVRDGWPAAVPAGLVVANDVAIETLADDLRRLALVALGFPKWTDGRAYSQARLLRLRLRFAGEIRATGEVLVDMLPLLQRTGFDAVVLRPDQSLAAARRALAFFPDGHYQGDVNEPRPLLARAPAERAGA